MLAFLSLLADVYSLCDWLCFMVFNWLCFMNYYYNNTVVYQPNESVLRKLENPLLIEWCVFVCVRWICITDTVPSSAPSRMQSVQHSQKQRHFNANEINHRRQNGDLSLMISDDCTTESVQRHSQPATSSAGDSQPC